MVITESWAKPSLDDIFFTIFGYSLYRRDRVGSKGGGILIYVLDSLPSVEVLEQELVCFDDCSACKISLPDGSSLMIAAFYRSPNSSDTNNSFLAQAMSKVMTYESTYHILCGDFNFPDINWHLNTYPPGLDYFMDVVNENNLRQFVFSPTRGCNVLDLVFCDNSAIVSNVIVREPLGLSDHNIVVVDLNIPLFTKRDVVGSGSSRITASCKCRKKRG